MKSYARHVFLAVSALSLASPEDGKSETGTVFPNFILFFIYFLVFTNFNVFVFIKAE